MPSCVESILRVTVESVQGNQVNLDWIGISGLLEWWHNPGVPLEFQGETASTGGVMGMPGFLSRPSREMDPHLKMRREEKGLFLGCGVTLGVPLEWRQVCWGTS